MTGRRVVCFLDGSHCASKIVGPAKQVRDDILSGKIDDDKRTTTTKVSSAHEPAMKDAIEKVELYYQSWPNFGRVPCCPIKFGDLSAKNR
jgi:hypothetical protein